MALKDTVSAAEPFPAGALPANRKGQLSASQLTAIRSRLQPPSRPDRRLGWLGIAVGAVILLTTAVVRPTSIWTWILGGCAAAAAGWAVLRTPPAAARPLLEGVWIHHIDGVISKPEPATSGDGPWSLRVGARLLTVTEAQWRAAPSQGQVRVYVLAGDDEVINLESIAEPTTPEPVQWQQPRDRGPMTSRAFQAAMSGPDIPDDELVQPADGTALQQALLGSWRSPTLAMGLDFVDEDKVQRTAAGQTSAETWAPLDEQRIRIGGQSWTVRLGAGRLALEAEGGPRLTFERDEEPTEG